MSTLQHSKDPYGILPIALLVLAMGAIMFAGYFAADALYQKEGKWCQERGFIGFRMDKYEGLFCIDKDHNLIRKTKE